LSQEKLALPDMFAEKKKLEKRISELEQEKRLALLNEIIDLQIENATAKAEDRQTQLESLKSRLNTLSESDLIALKAELQRIYRKVAEKKNTKRHLYR